MRRGSLSLGRIAGIPIFVHWSFFLIIIYFAFTTWRSGEDLYGILAHLGLMMSVFGCVLLHELGHALAARRYGIPTSDITLLPIGGLARLERIPEEPKKELVVAIAGPAVNVVIAAVLYAAVFLLGIFDTGVTQNTNTGMTNSFLLNLGIINLVLVVFNLIPAFPMDGGRVLRALLSMMLNRVKATRIAAAVGQVLAVGFAIWGFTGGQPFMVLIAAFVFFGARMEAKAVATTAYIQGYRVFNAMRTRFQVLQVSDPVAKGVQELLAGSEKEFVVMDGDNFAGLVSRESLMDAMTANRADIPVAAIADKGVTCISPQEELGQAQSILSETGQGLLPVVDEGKVIGVVDSENISEFIMIREAAGGTS